MTARLLDGRPVASRLWREASERVERLLAEGAPRPRLAIVRFGGDGPSAVYSVSLERAARGAGLDPLIVEPSSSVALADLCARIGALSRDPAVAGIVVAQPVPDHLDVAEVIACIDPRKDVDGAHPLNAGRLARGDPAFVPATALAIMTLLEHYEIGVAGRRAVVIGRSAVVGRPVAALLLAADATVVVSHRGTRNLARETRRAEILVSAAGSPGLVRPEMVSRGCVVIDAGITTTTLGLAGDVDFAAVRPVVAAITPVPGGVGTVTPMVLIRAAVEAAEGAWRAAVDEGVDRFAGLWGEAVAPAATEPR